MDLELGSPNVGGHLDQLDFLLEKTKRISDGVDLLWQ